MKKSKIYALAALFLFLTFIAASAYYFAVSEADVTGNVISLKNIFKKQITDSRVRIPAEKPVYSFNISGVFASAWCGNISNLSIDIFMESNQNYNARVKWKTSPNPEASFLYLTGYGKHRLTGDIIQTNSAMGYSGTDASVSGVYGNSNIEMKLDNLEENKKYSLETVSFWEGGCAVRYKINITTPPIGVADEAQCKKIIDNGPMSDKLNLIFVPYNYTAAEITTGRFERDVRDVLFEHDLASSFVGQRRSFFELPVLNASSKAFNIFIVNKSVSNSNSINQFISAAKSCGRLNKERDMIVVLANTNEGMSYASGIGSGVIIWLSIGERDTLQGITLAHEMAHLIGFDEEYYYWADPGSSPRNAPNCEYGNLTCEKFCSGVNAELTEEVHSAKRKAMQCVNIIGSGDASEWQTFCPTLDLEGWFEAHPIWYGGSTNIEEFCALPLSTSLIYACYAGTLMPLEDENIGIDCKAGYGCYFGCGTRYEYTKGSYVSIMGGGAMGEDNRIYSELDAASPTPIMPDFSKADSDILERYFSQFTTKYTLARSFIVRVPSRRIPIR